ncbi:hypothetical protein Cri9333_2751 [Crinalium epipsammum PCC 9333]|uniref:Uncharacterized protein n=1 Tax=Crinalium epipsammum PCC 9333 TaxID=1173022 RepID=K9W068_9CYAN|nr:hypothetical protein [Crinalium epipsammum]AFZ13601.1 hypothetical protein Cri9333_2751 [Crinalium epipsammum PCC 9333]
MSPSVGTGVDINRSWFHGVYAVFAPVPGMTHFDFMQHISRVRMPIDGNYNYSMPQGRKLWQCQSLTTIQREMLHKPAFGESLPDGCYDLKADGTRELVNEGVIGHYNDLLAKVTQLRQYSGADLSGNFANLVLDRGHSLVNAVIDLKGEADQLKQELKGSSEQLTQDRINGILEAPEINDAEYETLVEASKQDGISKLDQYKLGKHRIKTQLGVTDPSVDLVSEVVKSNLLGKIRAYRMVFKASPEWLAELDRREVLDSSRYKTDRSFHTAKAELIKVLIPPLVLDGGSYTKEDLISTDFCEQLKKHSPDIKRLLGFHPNPSDPVSTLNKILSQFGLKAEARRERLNGKPIRVYTLDLDRKLQIDQWASYQDQKDQVSQYGSTLHRLSAIMLDQETNSDKPSSEQLLRFENLLSLKEQLEAQAMREPWLAWVGDRFELEADRIIEDADYRFSLALDRYHQILNHTPDCNVA